MKTGFDTGAALALRRRGLIAWRERRRRGFVHVRNGCHELGTGGDGPDEVLSPVRYSWNSTVALVTIRRICGGEWA